jgi:glycosyltransferase involved in cell wall biosynthesis
LTAPERPAVTWLARRLRTVAPHILGENTSLPDSDDSRRVGTLFSTLVSRCARDGTEPLWLLLSAISGVLPTADDVAAATRMLDLERGARAEVGLLDIVAALSERGDPRAHLVVVSDAVAIDVTCALHPGADPGARRLLGRTLPRWTRDHEIVPMTWTAASTALRTLRAPDTAMLSERLRPDVPPLPRPLATTELVLPWRTTLIVPDVPPLDAVPRLAALARLSGNRLAVVGHNLLPVVAADLRSLPEANRAARSLEVLKYADVVATVGAATHAEYAGLIAGLSSQGLPGPSVVGVSAPAAAPVPVPQQPADGATGRPVVLCVGPHNPEQNHLTLLHAARRLWREGFDFELVFAGDRGHGDAGADACHEAVVRAGLPVHDLGTLGDDDLAAAYRSATVSVAVPWHEDLTFAAEESLACGTPVLVSGFGSLAKLGSGGGGLAVDPRDDDAVTDGLRRLVSEPALVAELRAQAVRRPTRTWDDFSDDLWDALAPGGAR